MRIADIKVKHIVIGLIIFVIICLIGQAITKSELEKKERALNDARKELYGF